MGQDTSPNREGFPGPIFEGTSPDLFLPEHIVGESDEFVALDASGNQRPLESIDQLLFDRPAWNLSTSQLAHPCELVFRNGDRWLVDLVKVEPTAITVRWRDAQGEHDRSVSRGSLRAIRLGGGRGLLADLVLSEETQTTWDWTGPLDSGELSWSIRQPEGESDFKPPRLRISLGDPSETLGIYIGKSIPLNDWSFDPGRDDYRVLLGWHEGRLRILINETLVAERPIGTVRRITLAAETDIAIPFRVLGETPAPVRPNPDPQVDRVTLTNGNEIFGRIGSPVEYSPSESLSILGILGPWQTRWAQVACWDLARQSAPVVQLPQGLLAEVELMRPRLAAWPGDWQPIRLTGVLTKAHGDSLNLVHPDLGNVTLAFDEVRRIRPLGPNRWRLAQGPWHLGNEARRDWPIVPPDGTELDVAFELEAAPQPGSHLVIDVEDLANTLGPNGEKLKAGQLTTRVLVNNRDLGTLHEAEALAGQQARRLPLPRDVLRSGPNTIRFEQTPDDSAAHEYDDLLIHTIWLEEPR